MRTESSLQQQSPTLPSDEVVPLDKKDRSFSSSSVSTNISKNTTSPPPSPPLGPRPLSLVAQLFGGRNSKNDKNTSKTNNLVASSSRRRGLKDEHRTSSTTRSSDKKRMPVIRVGAEDEQLRRNRRTVDHYLRRIGALMGRDVGLNERGMAFFSFQSKFVVVVEVPEDNHNTMYLYTMVCQADRNAMAIVKRAMELNYMQYGTAGATLGLDGDEINYCYSCKIAHLNFDHLRSIMESFLLTAVEIHKELDAVKRQPDGGGGSSSSSSKNEGLPHSSSG